VFFGATIAVVIFVAHAFAVLDAAAQPNARIMIACAFQAKKPASNARFDACYRAHGGMGTIVHTRVVRTSVVTL